MRAVFLAVVALAALGCTEPQPVDTTAWSFPTLDTGPHLLRPDEPDWPDLPRDTGVPTDAICSGNLLTDGGFEHDVLLESGWMQQGEVYFSAQRVADNVVNGDFAARITNNLEGEVALSQTVPVDPSVVYEYTAWVAWEAVHPLGPVGLQVAFLDRDLNLLYSTDLPTHAYDREFGFDFPPRLKLRSPAQAAFAAVRLRLGGRGSLWVDDVCFRPAPTGDFTGIIHHDGEPLPGARVTLAFEHWGAPYEAFSDFTGRYVLRDVPVAQPNYVLIAGKPGYRSRSQGHLLPIEGEQVEVDFELVPGDDPTDLLEVRFATLDVYTRGGLTRIHKYAEIPDDPSEYPDHVRIHLGHGEYLDTSEPTIQQLAEEILASVPERDRENTREVAWAVYEWLAKNIEYEAIYTEPEGPLLDYPWVDHTSTVLSSTPDGWGWGSSILDAYLEPEEILEHRSGICAEISSLAVVLLRNLDIPARTSQGTMELWYQLPDGSESGWVELMPSHGRSTWRTQGVLGAGFEMTRIPIASVHADPIQQATWDFENGGFWRENHPWEVYWQYDDLGHSQALEALEALTAIGRTPEPGGAAYTEDASYRANFRRMEFQLIDFVDQQELTLSFPFSTDSPFHATTGEYAYWVNLPDTVVGVEITEDFDATGETSIKQAHITLDLSSVL